MRRVILAISVLFLLSSAARADDSQLQKAYGDTLIQLKAAQDAKNELAGTNEKLGKQLEDTKKQLAASQARIRELERQVSDNDGKNFYLRSFYAAWQTFMKMHPDLAVRWKLYLGEDALAMPQEPRPLIDFGIADPSHSPDRGDE
jgi:TolA-binding protein